MAWNFQKICRTCTNQATNLSSIFESDQYRVSPADMLMACTCIQVSEDDDLPPFMCGKCTESLKLAFDFKIQSEENDSSLREYLKKTNAYDDVAIAVKNSLLTSSTDMKLDAVTVESEEEHYDYHSSKVHYSIVDNTMILPVAITTENRYIEENQSPEYKLMELFCSDSEISEGPQVSDIEKIKTPNYIDVKCNENEQGKIIEDDKEENNSGPKTRTIKRTVKMAISKGSKQLCPVCGKIFKQNQELLIHLRRHRGDKPLKCQFCGKGFLRTVDLRTHEARHLGEKRHFCTTCGKGFFRRYMLTRHMRSHTGERPFVCVLCNAAFAQINDLNAHVRRHTGECYPCDMCDKNFLLAYALSAHKRKKHGLDVPRRKPQVERVRVEDPDECVDENNAHQNSFSPIPPVLQNKQSDKPIKCRICNDGISNKYVLMKHMQDRHNIIERQHSKAELYKNKCLDGCNASFSQKKHLIEHLQQVHNKDIVMEELDFDNFDVFEMWLKNMQDQDSSEYTIVQSRKKVKNGTKTYYDCCRSGMYVEKKTKKRQTKLQGSKKINRNCTSSITLFEDAITRKCHTTICRTHYGHGSENLHLRLSLSTKYGDLIEDENKFVPYTLLGHDIRLICEICDAKLQTLDDLTRHKYEVHCIEVKDEEESNKRFPCDRCDKSFVSEKNKSNHIYIVHEKITTCKTCKVSFKGSDELNKHNTRNNDCSKKYLCPDCGCRFRAANALEIHLRRHRGVKPFKCSICEKGFACAFDLLKHEWRHEGQSKLTCTICQKEFLSTYKLNEHLCTHVGQKPYKCIYCEAVFSQMKILNTHMRRHTRNQYVCEVCPEEFPIQYLLLRHLQQVHGIVESPVENNVNVDTFQLEMGVVN